MKISIKCILGLSVCIPLAAVSSFAETSNPNTIPTSVAVTTAPIARVIKDKKNGNALKSILVGATNRSEARLSHSKSNVKQGILPEARNESSVAALPRTTSSTLPVGRIQNPADLQPKQPFAGQSVIFNFPTVQNMNDRALLIGKLQGFNSNHDEANLKIADQSDFINQASVCASSNSACVIVPDKFAQDFNGFRTLISLSSTSVGMIVTQSGNPSSARVGHDTHRTMSDGSNPAQPAARGSSGYPSSYGNSLMSYTNSNSNLYYIPDNQSYPSGSSQYAGAWLPAATASIISPTAKIKNVTYDISVYHTYHKDLIIDFGYDASSLGGGTYFMSGHVANRPTGISSGFHTYHGNTHEFDGLHPDSYYYVEAYDVASVDYGYINYINYQIDWVDFPNLTFYNGTINNYMLPLFSNRYLTVAAAPYNDSEVNVSSPFSMAWYSELDTSVAKNCSNLSYDPASANAWLVGYTDFSSLAANSYATTGLSSVDLDLQAANSSGYYMNSGKYCLWQYVDDLSQVTESDEAGISPTFVPWDNISDLGGFNYVYQSNKPDLTFNYASASGVYAVTNAGVLSASAEMINDSSVAVTNGFEIAWYFTETTTTSCGSLSLDANTAFFVGAKLYNSAAAHASMVVSVPPVNVNFAENPAGQKMSSGKKYCLWAWADDFDTVGESDETNNVLVYSTPMTLGVLEGVMNHASGPVIKVFPNPTVDYFKIELPSSLQSDHVAVSVIDFSGKEVRVLPAESYFGRLIDVDVRDLPVGVYIVTVEDSKGNRSTQKISKL